MSQNKVVLDGRVDVLTYPNMARMLLFRRVEDAGTTWILRTSDDVDWPEPWGEKAFNNIAKGLLRH